MAGQTGIQNIPSGAVVPRNGVVWSVAILALVISRHASASPGGAAAEQQAGATDVDVELLCDHAAPLRILGKGAVQRFTISADGSIALTTSKATELTFAFAGEWTEAVARVSSLNHPDDAWCARVAPGRVYGLAPTTPPLPSEGDSLQIQLYVAKAGSPPGFDEERAKVLASTQATERAAVHRVIHLQAFATALATAQLEAEIAATTATFDATVKAADGVLAELAGYQRLWQCPSGELAEPMSAAVCDELGKVLGTMVRASSFVRRVRSAVPSQRAQPISAVLKADDPLSKDYYETLPQLASTLAAAPPLELSERARQCTALGKLRWLDSTEMMRLAARAIVPVLPPEQLVVVAYGGSTAAMSGADLRLPWGLIVTGVPTGTKLSFGTRLGKAISVDPASAIATTLRYVIAGVTSLGSLGLKSTLNAQALIDHEPGLKLEQTLGMQSLLCADPSTTGWQVTRIDAIDEVEQRFEEFASRSGESTDALERLAKELSAKVEPKRSDNAQRGLVISYTVDSALAPTAKVETQAQIFTRLGNSKVIDLVACSGETCTADDDKSVRARVSITPDRTGSWTLLADVTFGFGLASRYGGIWSRGPFAIQNAPSFDPIDRGDGPDQLYELELRADPRNTVSTGLIVGAYLNDRWLFGAGPAILVGTSGGAFTQWNARLAYRLTESGSTFLTLGPSVRLLPVPADYDLHDRVSVVKSMSGTASAPTARTYYSPELQFDVGLGIDLGALGSSVSDTIKSFGGK